MTAPKSWTRQDENQAFLQGWNIFRGLIGHEKDIIRIRSDAAAFEFVSKMAPTDSLAKKALHIHKQTLALHERVAHRRHQLSKQGRSTGQQRYAQAR